MAQLSPPLSVLAGEFDTGEAGPRKQLFPGTSLFSSAVDQCGMAPSQPPGMRRTPVYVNEEQADRGRRRPFEDFRVGAFRIDRGRGDREFCGDTILPRLPPPMVLCVSRIDGFEGLRRLRRSTAGSRRALP